MASLTTKSGEISFTDEGAGDGIVLVHGFAASAQENWVKAGWVTMLTRAKRRVIALDLLGHGHSAKPHNPGAYTFQGLADDVLAVVDHLQVKKPDVIGFSLGARVALDLLSRHPNRFLLGVFCGVGERLLVPHDVKDRIALPEALEALSADTLEAGLAKQFRQFAEAQGQDLKALAACSRGLNLAAMEWSRDALREIRNESLVVAGSGDDLAGSAAGLASSLGNAKGKQVPGCGHMDCLTQPMFKAAVMDFLAGVPD